jgi:CheY-like chemotaxis protein
MYRSPVLSGSGHYLHGIAAEKSERRTGRVANMKVLIVDDEPDIRDSLCEFFEEEGFSVSSASNGAEALGMLGAGDTGDLPGIIILDLIMPLMGGNELYSRMQSDPRLSSVPVLVSTANPSLVPRGIPTLKKPVDLCKLLDLVHLHGAWREAPNRDVSRRQDM